MPSRKKHAERNRNKHRSCGETYRRFSNIIKSDPKTLSVQFTQTRQGVNGREQRVTIQQDFNDQDELKSFLKDIENLMLTNPKKKDYVVVEEPDEASRNPDSNSSECEFRNQAPKATEKRSHKKPQIYKTFEQPIPRRYRVERNSTYLGNSRETFIQDCYYFDDFQKSKSTSSRMLYEGAWDPPPQYNHPYAAFQNPYAQERLRIKPPIQIFSNMQLSPNNNQYPPKTYNFFDRNQMMI